MHAASAVHRQRYREYSDNYTKSLGRAQREHEKYIQLVSDLQAERDRALKAERDLAVEKRDIAIEKEMEKEKYKSVFHFACLAVVAIPVALFASRESLRKHF